MREKRLISAWIIPVPTVIMWLRYTSQSGSFSILQVLIQHRSKCLSRQLAGLHSPSLGTYQFTSSLELLTSRTPFIGLSLNIGLSTHIYFEVCRQDRGWLTTPEMSVEQKGLHSRFSAPEAWFWQSEKLWLDEKLQGSHTW